MYSGSSVAEPRRTPGLSLLLGYGAMAPFAMEAVAAWLLDARWAALAVELAVVWGGAILAFLSGVRRGLSFRTAGGPTAAQIATTLWLFALALAALAVPWTAAALALLLVGNLSLGVLDPWATPTGARHRPPLYEAHVVRRDLLRVPNGVSDEIGIGLAASVRRFAAPPCIRSLHGGG